MKAYAKKIIKHPLFSGSMIMIIGSNFSNFIAWLYHFVISRVLSVPEYGELVSIISLLGLTTSIFSFINIVVMKFVSGAETKDLPKLLNTFSKKLKSFGIITVLIYLLLSPAIAAFLKIDYIKVAIASIAIYVALYNSLYRAFLNGLLKFSEAVLSNVSSTISRLLFGLILVLMGLSVLGAEIGLILGFAMGVLISKYFLRDITSKIKAKTKQISLKPIIKYSAPILIFSAVNNSFLMTDVLFVKHYFSLEEAGIYGSVSTLAKIILFATAPISNVMFPLVSQAHSNNKPYKSYLFLSSLLTIGFSSFILLIYLFLPELVINTLYRKEFLGAAPLLFWMGLFIAIYSIATMFVNFYLSINKTSVVKFTVISAFVQIFGIILFHNTLLQVIQVSIFAAFLLLLQILIYLIKSKGDEK